MVFAYMPIIIITIVTRWWWWWWWWISKCNNLPSNSFDYRTQVSTWNSSCHRINFEVRELNTQKSELWVESLACPSAITSKECAVLPTSLAPLVSPSSVVIPLPSLPLGRWWKSIGNNRWEMVVFLGGISEISRRPCSYYMTNECCFPSLLSNVGSIIEPGLGQLWYWFSFVISDSLLK